MSLIDDGSEAIDQAAALRKRVSASGESGHHPERIIAVASGKGGVGKSNIALNLGIELSLRGRITYLLDADFGMGNANILAGITPRFTLSHLIQKGMSVEEVVTNGPGGLRIIPGVSGNARVANLSVEQRRLLCRGLAGLKERADYLVMDVGAGISQNVISFLEKADEAIVVVIPEPTSMADAYGLIKSLVERSFASPISIVVNRARSIGEAKMTADRMIALTMQYLEQPVRWGGFLLEDSAVGGAVLSRRPFSAFKRSSLAAKSVGLIADRIERRALEIEERDFKIPASWGVRRWFERVFH